ncbi:unnamed protein product [Meganyctiphanes norvegica]|uniref:Uncharacterized protein n=1 Tax=Meganyctiphanes norvegica TaxID=48144 RepID=A0AAV2QCI2_MEGNR
MKKIKLDANGLCKANDNKNDELEMVIEDGVMETGVLLEGDLQDEASYLLWPSEATAYERIENAISESNNDDNESRAVYFVQNEEFIPQDVREKDVNTKESEDMTQSSYVNFLGEQMIDQPNDIVSSFNSANSSNQQIIGSSNNQCIASTHESFVIPADISEWNKLFEVLSSQIESGVFDVDKTVRGINLLASQDSITEISLIEQVNIFNELCDITNVQVD